MDSTPATPLHSLNTPPEDFVVDPFALVIFGGTGDLSQRKLLPALYHLFVQDELGGDFSILGLARSPKTDEEYRDFIREALVRSGEPFEDEKWRKFRRRLYYFSGDWGEMESYARLCAVLARIAPGGEKRNVIYYLALPPQVTTGVVARLEEQGLCRGFWNPKIILEKPFGRDLSSAAELNRVLTRVFQERQIYRIDHYLGKDTVQNIIIFRFANSVFERLWDSRHIDHVQITVAEELGIENRGAFYEETGVVRDMVQNHILQILTMVAMEPPFRFSAEAIRDEKAKVLRSIYPLDADYVDRFTVRGQYGPGKIQEQEVPGYRAEKGVAPDSAAATFFAGKFYVANWRWAGVPFYVRTGKRMARRITEVAVVFKQPPLRLFAKTCDPLEPNVLLLGIQPEEKISLRLDVKVPGSTDQVSCIFMNFSYPDFFQTVHSPAYERLMIDCLKGDLTLFVREDAVDAAWEAVDPILARWESNAPENFPNYAAGSWGPSEADLLLQREGRHWFVS